MEALHNGGESSSLFSIATQINRNPTPLHSPTSPSSLANTDLEETDGAISKVFLNIIKAQVVKQLEKAIAERMRECCHGCHIDHSSLGVHICLDPIPRYYVYNHFKDLMKKLWTDEFLPKLMKLLKTRGLVAPMSRIVAICKSFLYDLKDEPDISQRIKMYKSNYTIIDPECY